MSFLDRAAQRLRAAEVESPRTEARLLLAHVLGVRPETIAAHDVVPEGDTLAAFETVLARRIAHEPLAYITGWREFWSLNFMVGPGVLVPRPESETLVEEALRRFSDDRPFHVLDLGAGSGCLLLAFLSERPNATGCGVDGCADAVAIAARNAANLNLGGRAQFHHGDWTHAPAGPFDVIFSNPPYICDDELSGLSPEVTSYEPHLALSGGRDGLDAYRAIMPVIASRLTIGGYAFIELGQGQAGAVTAIALAAALDVGGIIDDLAGIPRCLVLAWPAPAGERPKKSLEMGARSG